MPDTIPGVVSGREAGAIPGDHLVTTRLMEVTVLSLAEQTTLLLYRGEVSAHSSHMGDTFHRYGRSGSLICAAVLMDLALRGRVAMERSLPAHERANGEGCAGALISVVAFLLAMFGPILVTFTWPILPVVPYAFLPVILCPLVIAMANVSQYLATDKLRLVDATPTGDDLLDATLRGMARIGARARIKTYIRRHFTVPRLLGDLSRLRERLERLGCVDVSGQSVSTWGFVETSRVDRGHPAFQAIGTHIRPLLLEGLVPDGGAVALALLFSGPGTVGWRRIHGVRALQGLYQFFADEELPTVRQRLTEIVDGDPLIAAQVGSDLYDTLLAIRQGLEEVRSDASGGHG